MNAYAVATAPDSLRIERLLPGPIERIWSYLTDSQLRARWLAAGAMELVPGGQVEHVFHNSELTQNDDPAPAKYQREAGSVRLQGRIIECAPPHLLAYSWGEGPEASEVRFELSDRDDKVLLVVNHRRLVQHGERLSVAAGWHTHLDILAARLESREPEGFWRRHAQLEAEYEQRLAAAGQG